MNFLLNYVFSARYIRFCFFFEFRRFFQCHFFLICFHRSSSQFLLETKRFASIKDSSRFSALCDLPQTFLNFLFLKGFPLRKMAFPVSCWGRMVFKTYAYPFGSFWRCKSGEILTMLFYPWFSV